MPSIAIAKGAEVIEKHVCLDNIKTVDSEFSLKSSEFKDFVLKINDTFKICQKKSLNKNITFSKNKIFQRSIYAIKNIKKGEYFNDENIKTFRPSLGLSAEFFLSIIGKKSPQNIEKNKPLPKKIIKIV